MSAAENVRSFWAAKARSESPTGPTRPREGRTMEGLRTTLERSQIPQMSPTSSRALPIKPGEGTSRSVRNNVFLERDRTPSPATSPTFGRKSPFAKDLSLERSEESRSSSPIMPRSVSPYKSSFASPEPALKNGLSRSKSVTFNESLEVRHMSDCSFEEPSSPISVSGDHNTRDHRDIAYSDSEIESEDEKMDNVLSSEVESTSVIGKRRALPAIPGARPLPILPTGAGSPETRVKATVEEETRRNISGLGLQLEAGSVAAGTTTEHDIDGPTTTILSECSSPVLTKISAYTKPVVDSLHSPALKPGEPAISKENIREKLAQRKAAKDQARKEQELALTPNNSLAPPLPHYDSFVKLDEHSAATALEAPGSPLSDTSDMAAPQRKVSDNFRPMTPIEQITTNPQQPQSGRALHHEREKRLSLDVSPEEPPPTSRPGFTAISYDGDDYGNSDDEFVDDIIIHDTASEVAEPGTRANQDVDHKTAAGLNKPSSEDPSTLLPVESPLQHLPEIPEIPVRDTSIDSPPRTPVMDTSNMRHMSLCLDFDNVGNDSLGLEQYMTPEKHPETPITSRTVVNLSPTKPDASKSSLLASWAEASEGSDKENSLTTETATITARGMKLRTRPSLTPGDATELAARRRQVSIEVQDADEHDLGQAAAIQESPEIGSSQVGVSSPSTEHESRHDQTVLKDGSSDDEVLARIQPMEMPVLQTISRELSFSDINHAFDRVMQKQKKGYVIRQQTRVVHATAHHEEPAKDDAQLNADGTKGHTRQSSSVYTTLSQMSGRSSEAGKEHRRLGSKIPVGVQMSPRPRAMTNESMAPVLAEKLDGGRLFIRVMHVKNLTLPIPKGEEAYFTCTLDNGKHCVTTPKHTLGVNTKINQEFELIADHDLEFILTLQAQYVPPQMPTRPKSTLGRLLNSPKKHKPTGSITSLSLAGYVSDNGSFARAHLALKHFRNKAFGRPYTMLVPILNEWAVETTGISSKSAPQTRVRKPYKIGNIELQVLYVPPVESEHRHALPTSLSQAVRDVRDAEWHSQLHCEGYLSQQGGDCPYWRRRHFKLVGPKLTAYHANTGQVRATINLAKATQVTDDKESLTAPEVTVGKGDHKTRRKSGFAEREEGHLYVAEGFRLRFANGELIDFYADSLAEKERWIQILKGIVQKIPVAKAWCQTVLEFEASRVIARR